MFETTLKLLVAKKILNRCYENFKRNGTECLMIGHIFSHGTFTKLILKIMHAIFGAFFMVQRCGDILIFEGIYILSK